MPRISETFGERVRQVFEERNWSLRAGTIATGIDYNTLNNMKSGIVPIRDKVIRFAEGIRGDINEWLEVAGYETIPPELISHAGMVREEAGRYGGRRDIDISFRRTHDLDDEAWRRIMEIIEEAERDEQGR